MSEIIVIDNLNCYCVPLSEANFNDIAAIYIIICRNLKEKTFSVIDIGQSGELGTRIDNHDRRSCWKRKCQTGEIWVCVYRMPSTNFSEKDRCDLEHNLRSKRTNLCGKR